MQRLHLFLELVGSENLKISPILFPVLQMQIDSADCHYIFLGVLTLCAKHFMIDARFIEFCPLILAKVD